MSHDMRTVWDNDLGESTKPQATLCSVGVAKVTQPRNVRGSAGLRVTGKRPMPWPPGDEETSIGSCTYVAALTIPKDGFWTRTTVPAAQKAGPGALTSLCEALSQGATVPTVGSIDSTVKEPGYGSTAARQHGCTAMNLPVI